MTLQSCIAVGLLLLTGCGQNGSLDIANWSKSVEVGKSSDSLSTSFSLYRWNGTIMAMGGDSGTYAARVLEDDGRTWKTVSTVDPGWIPMDADPNENRFVICRGTVRRDDLIVGFTIGSLSLEGQFASETNVTLRLDKTQLFGSSDPNLRMRQDERPGHVAFVGGITEGAMICLPYCIAGIPREGKTIRADLAKTANGIFVSSDAGHTWRSEPISIVYSRHPIVCRTEQFYYYFAVANPGPPFELWYARAPAGGGAWGPVEKLDKSFASNLSIPNLHAIAEKDTVHLCWLDARHERTHLSLTRPEAKNYEVAYSRRGDADSSWSKDVILSEGLRWAYAPSMSVDGNSVVVAWAGVRSDKEGRNEWNASDIYYAVSKDGGKTWTKPMKVTDRFKEGITSGRPQVALHKGVIHLFYIQGKINYKEVSAGMALLNQPPWPIYYTQRPFPNLP